jgi:ssDNA-binding Zn-finger/Zn-ribbon topoisomerase 1
MADYGWYYPAGVTTRACWVLLTCEACGERWASPAVEELGHLWPQVEECPECGGEAAEAEQVFSGCAGCPEGD